MYFTQRTHRNLLLKPSSVEDNQFDTQGSLRTLVHSNVVVQKYIILKQWRVLVLCLVRNPWFENILELQGRRGS